MKKLCLAILILISARAFSQTTSWSSTPVVTTQTRMLSGSPQVRFIWSPSYIYSLGDTVISIRSSYYLKSISDAKYITNNVSTAENKRINVSKSIRSDSLLLVSSPSTGYGIYARYGTTYGGLWDNNVIKNDNTAGLKLSGSYTTLQGAIQASIDINGISQIGVTATDTYINNQLNLFPVASGTVGDELLVLNGGYMVKQLPGSTYQLALGFTPENIANKTATQSSSATTYPNWLGVTNYVGGLSSVYQPLNAKLTAFSALVNASGVLTNNGSGVFSYTNPITGTGTINYIPKFTGTGAIGNGLIYDDGTHIGINTTSFTSASFSTDFVLKGGDYVGQIIQSNQESAINLSHDISGTLPFTQIADSYASFNIHHWNGTANYYSLSWDGTNTTLGSNVKVFGATGNVFVGNSPTDAGYKLDVNGTVRFSGIATATSFTGAGTGLTGTAASLNIGGNAATATLASTVITNANLTGVITSVGNATSIASQTGTGTTFVMDTSPTLVTPILGTPTSVTLTNGTGLPLTTGVTGILPSANGGTGVNNGSSTITLGGNLTTSGAFGTTITSTATTAVTLPTSGTLYGTATGSITSAQLATSLTNETGTGSVVYSASPTLTGTATVSAISAGGVYTVTGTSVGSAGNRWIGTDGASGLYLNGTTGNLIRLAINNSVIADVSGTGLSVTGVINATSFGVVTLSGTSVGSASNRWIGSDGGANMFLNVPTGAMFTFGINNSSPALSISASGATVTGTATATTLNSTTLTASQLVATDGSKNLVSVTALPSGTTMLGLSTAVNTFGSGSTTTTINHHTILCDATSGNVTVNLIAAGSATGTIYVIKRSDNTANTVTIDGSGSETIDGSLTKTISTQYAGYTIQSTGSAWVITGTF